MPTTAHRHQAPHHWLRERALGRCHQQGLTNQVSIDSMRRLQLEACLDGHQGCVNCLEWNAKGNLLLSGSDDRDVILWDPFKRVKRSTVKTGHEKNIFSVKFIPNSSDTLIATCAGDGSVKLTNIITNENVMDCKSCHLDRVKRLVTHPHEPHLIWSAGEDGYIMQYDIREEHSCKSTKPKNLLIDLKTAGLSLSAKCLAINPIRDEMLAVGSNDVHVRLFDRRYLRQETWDSCTAYFTPGHLLKPAQSTRKPNHHSYGTTYLAFSPDGTELLANIHAEQVYLFNTQEPWERYKTFDTTMKPLILDLPTTDYNNNYYANYGILNKKQQHQNSNTTKRLKPYSLWRELKKFYKTNYISLPEQYCEFYKDMSQKLKLKTPITKDEYDKMNELLVKVKNCPELYHLRAGALIQRGWRGDHYQSIRDSCCALALKPLDYSSLDTLAFASYHMGDKEAASGLLEILKTVQQQERTNQGANILKQPILVLSTLLRNSPLSSSNLWLDAQFETSGQTLDDEDDEMQDAMSDPIQTDDEEPTDEGANNNDFDPIFTMNYRTAAEFLLSNDINDLQLAARKESQRSLESFDYTKRFCGHCNMNTDIKEVNFFGYGGEFVVAGSDDGAFYIWDKETTNIVKAVYGDMQILNCLQPHPSICMLATSGIEPTVKLWSPSGKTCHDVKSLEQRCAQNQDFITSDPLEAMIMMLYPNYI